MLVRESPHSRDILAHRLTMQRKDLLYNEQNHESLPENSGQTTVQTLMFVSRYGSYPLIGKALKLHEARKTFQRVMYVILEGLNRKVPLVYLNEVMVF